MTVPEELAMRTAAAIRLYGKSFEWKGQSYPCARRDQPTMQEMQEEGGYIAKGTAWLVVSKSVFNNGDGPFPAIGDPVNNATAQIKKTNGGDDPDAAQLILTTGSFDE